MKFYVMIEFLGRLWVENGFFPYFLCHCFVFLHNSVISYLFSYKNFSECNFSMHCNAGTSFILIKSLKFRNNSRIVVTSLGSVIYCEKCEREFFEYCVLLLFSFRSGLRMNKNNTIEACVTSYKLQ